MPLQTDLAAELALRSALDGIPAISFPENLQAALRAGKRHWTILREVISLRRGPGKLTPQEYFYYRLWELHLSQAEKRAFVGKQAQTPMHHACNSIGWHAVADDKLLFHALISSAGLPVPRLLALVHPKRSHGAIATLRDELALDAFLAAQDAPIFLKPVDGKYSLGTYRLDDRGASLAGLAARVATHPGGYLIQEALQPHPTIAERFGPRLWSARLLILLHGDSPTVRSTVAKIATGQNVADNYWRPGNLLAAVDPSTGTIRRTVRGVGGDLEENPAHPDSRAPLLGTTIPDWPDIVELATNAATLLPGIRTQSWDVAITDKGPVLLEINWGGDLNLHQLAWGKGALDDRYRAHLRACGYPI